MERPADDIFKVLDLDSLRSPLPKHLFSSSTNTASTAGSLVDNVGGGKKENWLPSVPTGIKVIPPVPAFHSSPAQTINQANTSTSNSFNQANTTFNQAKSPSVTVFKPKPIYAVPSSPINPTALSPMINNSPINGNSSSKDTCIMLGGIQITPGRPSSTSTTSITPTPVKQVTESLSSIAITENSITDSINDTANTPLVEKAKRKRRTLLLTELSKNEKETIQESLSSPKMSLTNGSPIKKSLTKDSPAKKSPTKDSPIKKSYSKDSPVKKDSPLKQSPVKEQQQAEQQLEQQVKQQAERQEPTLLMAKVVAETEEKQSGDEQQQQQQQSQARTPKRRGRPSRKDKEAAAASSSSPEKPSVSATTAVYKNRIILLDWSLAIVPNSTKLTGIPLERLARWIVLVGRRPDMSGEAWHSSIVTERITSGQICTGSGRSLYVLEGPMGVEDMREHGFSDSFISKFQRGFPEDWRECLMLELDRLEQPPPESPLINANAPAVVEGVVKRKPGRPPKKNKPIDAAGTTAGSVSTPTLAVTTATPTRIEESPLVKRGRGRPRKNPPLSSTSPNTTTTFATNPNTTSTSATNSATSPMIPKKRGRKPKPVVIQEEAEVFKEFSPKKGSSPKEKSSPKKRSSPRKSSPKKSSLKSPVSKSPSKSPTSKLPSLSKSPTSKLIVNSPLRHSPRTPKKDKIAVEEKKVEAEVERVQPKKRGPGRPPKIKVLPQPTAVAEEQVIDVVTVEPNTINKITLSPNNTKSPNKTGKKRGRKPKNRQTIVTNTGANTTASVTKMIRTRRDSTASPVVLKRLWGGKVTGNSSNDGLL